MIAELGRGLFAGLLSELIVLIVTIRFRQDKRKAALVLLIGTLAAGLIGFGLQEPSMLGWTITYDALAEGGWPTGCLDHTPIPTSSDMPMNHILELQDPKQPHFRSTTGQDISCFQGTFEKTVGDFTLEWQFLIVEGKSVVAIFGQEDAYYLVELGPAEKSLGVIKVIAGQRQQIANLTLPSSSSDLRVKRKGSTITISVGEKEVYSTADDLFKGASLHLKVGAGAGSNSTGNTTVILQRLLVYEPDYK